MVQWSCLHPMVSLLWRWVTCSFPVVSDRLFYSSLTSYVTLLSLTLQTHGADQAPLVAQLLKQTSKFQEVRVVDDCFGVPRFVIAERAA
jgi:hypothetical protein